MAGEHQQAVLMADDDAEDCMLATEVFRESGAKGAFSCVQDGIELMNHLEERSRSDARGPAQSDLARSKHAAKGWARSPHRNHMPNPFPNLFQ